MAFRSFYLYISFVLFCLVWVCTVVCRFVLLCLVKFCSAKKTEFLQFSVFLIKSVILIS